MVPLTTRDHPYSPAVASAGLVFTSGALSVDADFQPVAGRRPALDAAMANVVARLQTEGAALHDSVRLTYYVTDISLRAEANEQFMELFSVPRPARTFVEVSGLPYGATVEIEAIAAPASPRVLPEA